MLLAVQYRVMEQLGSLGSTQEARVALGYRLGQLFVRALHLTSCSTTRYCALSMSQLLISTKKEHKKL